MINFQEIYGKSDPTCVAKVKSIYRDLDLQVWQVHFHVEHKITVWFDFGIYQYSH